MKIENIKVGEFYRLDRWTRVKVLALDESFSVITPKGGRMVLETKRGIKIVKVDASGQPARLGIGFIQEPMHITNHRRLTREKR